MKTAKSLKRVGLDFAIAITIALLPQAASAQNVLVYNSAPSGALNWYSGFGSLSVTYASDAVWAGMSTAQFAAYDMIWIGGLDTISGAGTIYNTVFSTRGTWGPAISGRALVTCLHVSSTVHPRAEAMTYVNDTVGWLLGGGGTALFVGSDGGTRAYDFLDFLGISGCSGLDCFSNNTVSIVAPTHPAMLNSTTGGLSNWSQSTHNRVMSTPPGWELLAQGAGSEPLIIARSMSCNITSPVMAAPVMGDAIITFNAFHPQMPVLNAFFEWSTNGGVTFQPCTDAASSARPNPSSIATPALGATFTWDTLADGVGTTFSIIAFIRLTITRGPESASCTTFAQVTNPTCGLTGGGCGDCDGDSFVNIIDALRAAKIDVGLSPMPMAGSDEFNSCNVSGVSYPAVAARVSILDALDIARHVVGLTSIACCTP